MSKRRIRRGDYLTRQLVHKVVMRLMWQLRQQSKAGDGGKEE
jgi:hypothetical protein